MLLGDLVRESDDKIHLGRFYEDKDALIQSLETLAAYRTTKIYMSHGTVMDDERLEQSIEDIKEQLQ